MRKLSYYFPIDENYPMQPQDPYGLSKLLDEQICKSASNQYGISTICLRFCWVWHLDNYKDRLRYIKSPAAPKQHWGYVDVRDIAQACRLAVEADNIKHDVFFITAADTYTEESSVSLTRKHFPEVSQISNEYLRHPNMSLFDISRARKFLGYEPKYSWRDIG